jgi:predicted kinase
MQRPENLLVVFFGMIATGKSYLASAWAGQFGLPYYNSDRVRKELAGVRPETDQQVKVDKGIYTPEFSRLTYDALLDNAAVHYKEDPASCVVLDGSYQSFAERDLLRKRFESRVRVVFVHCICDEQVVKERLAIRANDPDAVSDGNWEIYQTQKKRFQELTRQEHAVTINTDAAIEILLEQVNDALLSSTRSSRDM